MSDSGDPKQDKQRELDAEREFYEGDGEGTKDPSESYNREPSTELKKRYAEYSITAPTKHYLNLRPIQIKK